jgi:hypothetical protein
MNFGTVGKIRLKIPWTSLTSSPLVVNIEQVYIDLVSKPYDSWDDNIELENYY